LTKNASLSALLCRVLLIAALLSAADLLLLLLRGYGSEPGLLPAGFLSFGMYFVFISVLGIPLFYLTRSVLGRYTGTASLSVSLSIAAITVLAAGIYGDIGAGIVALGIASGLVSFTMLETLSKTRRQPLRIFTSLVMLVLALLWRSGTGADPGTFGCRDTRGVRTEELAGKPNIILLVIDTLRADRVGCYGNGDGLTPSIDAVREDGVLFENVIVPCPRTAQSMSTIMTGLYPHKHGVRRIFHHLSDRFTTLAEMLRDQGYETMAVVSNPVLRKGPSGLSQGFGIYDDAFIPSPYHHLLPVGLFQTYIHRIRLRTLDAASTTDSIIEHLAGRDRNTPFFLWVQYFDPHWLYLPPEGYRDVSPRYMQEINDIYDKFLSGEISMGDLTFNYPYSDSLLASFVKLYDGEVRFCDSQIGRLVSYLREEGLYDSSLLILTSDHGEGLGEHDYYFEHGLYLFENEVRVPFIMKYPAALSTDQNIFSGQVTTVDLLSNIFYTINLRQPDGLNSPLWFFRAGDRMFVNEASALVFGESGRSLSSGEAYEKESTRKRMVRAGNLKLIVDPSDRRRDGKPERQVYLYDLNADPSEMHDLSSTDPEQAQMLLDDLKGWYAGGKENQRNTEKHIDRTLLEDLKALGYFQ